MAEPALHALAAGVRRHDPDRFLCTLFAPVGRRPALFLLYALNHELARAAEVTREPGLALIRLAWWREVVEGARRQHALAAPLAEALASGALDRAALLRLIDAREAALEPPATEAEWHARLLAGPGELAAAAGAALGATGEILARLRRLGAGYGGAGELRSVGYWARLGQCRLPADALAAAGLTAASVVADPGAVVARGVAAALAGSLRDWLGELAPAGAGLAAALPAVLARRDLRRPGMLVPRGFADRAAVLLAAARRMA